MKPRITIKSSNSNATFVIEFDRMATTCWHIVDAPEYSELQGSRFRSLEKTMSVIAVHLGKTEF